MLYVLIGMNTNKIKYDLEESLKKTSGTVKPILSKFLGYIFLGKKHLKDGSYIRTCWLTFFYFPIAPLDTYRIVGDTEKGLFPKNYKVDEFLPFQKTQIQFDYFQVLTSGLIIWAPAFSVIFFALIYPLAVLAGVLISVASFSIYQLSRTPNPDLPKHNTIAELKSRLLEKPQIVTEPKRTLEKSKKTIPKVPVAKQSIPIPKPNYQNVEEILPPLPEEKYIPEGNGRFGGFAPVKSEVIEEKHGHGLISLGILNILLVLIYLFYFGYFKVSNEITGLTVWVYKIFIFLGKNYLLALISFNIGLVIALLRSKVIGVILILFAVGLFMHLDAKFWDYLYSCCLVV
jgi:hypothetical protein